MWSDNPQYLQGVEAAESSGGHDWRAAARRQQGEPLKVSELTELVGPEDAGGGVGVGLAVPRQVVRKAGQTVQPKAFRRLRL